MKVKHDPLCAVSVIFLNFWKFFDQVDNYLKRDTHN